MSWILEEPLYIGILGTVAFGLLGFAWLQTGWRWLLVSLLGVVAVTVALLLAERWVETDAEQVKHTLHRIAERVEANDLDGVLQYLAQGAPDVEAQARAEFPKYRFKRVAIKRNLEVIVDNSQVPPQATASFNVVVDGEEQSFHGAFHVPRFVEVKFVKENGRWLVLSYQHWDPQTGMRLSR